MTMEAALFIVWWMIKLTVAAVAIGIVLKIIWELKWFILFGLTLWVVYLVIY